ncbi:Unknown protein [Striga hermonthica]|uniref:DUF4283 domain-containing protein n=1 Tax=Striga hermonthica TaxID=68872 RepID=A0A9N7MUV5_STRHE|nr:Unknown protein [Striga hermonthica]
MLSNPWDKKIELVVPRWPKRMKEIWFFDASLRIPQIVPSLHLFHASVKTENLSTHMPNLITADSPHIGPAWRSVENSTPPSLPRPRFYTDVKFNLERIDPPPPVLDPLMSWAMDAHWSMGGLSFKRHRLQGRIEGKVERLRTQREQISTKSASDSPAVGSGKKGGTSRVRKSPSPPPPPVALKRRRVVGLIDEEDDEEEVVAPPKRGPVRKLGDDFERVARESGIGAASGGEAGGAVAGRTRSKRVEMGAGADEGKMKKKKKLVKGGRRIGAAVVAATTGKRSSPRLAKSATQEASVRIWWILSFVKQVVGRVEEGPDVLKPEAADLVAAKWCLEQVLLSTVDSLGSGSLRGVGNMGSELEEDFKNFSLSAKEEGGIEIEEDDIRTRMKECSLSLMGSLFGEKRASFLGLKNTLQNIWLTKKPFFSRMVGSNKYQFIFQTTEDRKKVLEGKAWTFDGQYLLLKEWSEENNGYTEEEHKVELWVQIHDLPLHWVTEEVGMKVGKLFGKVVDVVVPEMGGVGGRMVKILVELNLNEPILRGTHLKMGGESKWVSFKYENLQNFCYYCGGLDTQIDRVARKKRI